MLSMGMISIYASGILLLCGGLVTIALRHDLLTDAIVSGIAFAVLSALFFILYTYLFPTIVAEWWNTELLIEIPFVQYPLEEIMWAFAFGFSAGPMYEFLAGLRFRSW